MTNPTISLFQREGGTFTLPPEDLIKKLRTIETILFDWDGVFNNGHKVDKKYGSTFSEIDAMGTNMLRYAWWRWKGDLPITAIITGEDNLIAQELASRENFHEIMVKAKNKVEVFEQFCNRHSILAQNVLFFFDDILDLKVAQLCGVRVMIRRKSTALLNNFVLNLGIADYLTASPGGEHGLREGCELAIGLIDKYAEVVQNRMEFSVDYQSYLSARQSIETMVLGHK